MSRLQVTAPHLLSSSSASQRTTALCLRNFWRNFRKKLQKTPRGPSLDSLALHHIALMLECLQTLTLRQTSKGNVQGIQGKARGKVSHLASYQYS